MFVYIDESGNTGTQILDHTQPHFWYLALMARFDFHEQFGREFTKIALRQGYDYIHASASSAMDNDYFCSNVFRLLQNVEFGFALVLIEKKAHAATLFYDFLIENNPGLPFYQTMMQAIWRAAICELLDDASQDLFWHKCVNGANEAESNEALLDLCRYFIGRLDTDPEIKNRIDPRIKELFTDCLAWAVKNPDDYSQFIKRKVDRLKTSPTVMAYVELVKMIRDQIEFWGESNCTVKHDQSEQFEKAITETHAAICSDIPLEFTLSKQNAGLQLCDLFLSIVRRDAMELPISLSQEKLHDFIWLRKERQYFLLTYQTLQEAASETVEWANSLPVTDAEIEKGKKYVARENERRRNRISSK